MTDLLLVGAGGALGSIFRYRIGRWIAERASSTFPVGTFLINLSGAVLLGIILNLQQDRNALLIATDGFLGAYTTFSTFMYEGFDLLRENEKASAAVYVIGSLVLGVAGYMAGAGAARYFL